MNELNNWYVYRHYKGDLPLECFYIGVGLCKRRFKSKHNRNIFWHRVVEAHGFYPEIVASNLTMSLAHELEILLISEYGKRCNKTGPLVNLTDGGDGSLGHRPSIETLNKLRSRKISPETRRKLVQARKRTPTTAETKAKIAATNRLPDRRKHMSEIMKGRVVSLEARAKRSKSLKGREITIEAREKLRKANLGKKASLETRLKMSESRKGKKQSKETGLKKSAALKAYHKMKNMGSNTQTLLDL